MKKKVLYYIFLILATIVAIYIFSINQYSINNAIQLKTQNIITSQNIEPKRLYINAWRNIKNEYVDPKMNGQDWERWKKRYLPYIKTNEDVYVAVNTMLQSLDDPYSRFMNIPEFENQNISIDSKISGIGINLMSIAGKIVISNVIEDSPASKAGLIAGDIIVKINDTSVQGLSLESAVKLIRGEQKTVVKLDIVRNNKRILRYVERNLVRLKSVKTVILKNNIGYIRVASFMGIYVPQEFEGALKKTRNTKALILDLRGDAGGLLNNAIIMANMMINKGDIVSIVYRNGQKITMHSQKTAFYPDKPIVILINKGTASSSEILTGALRDNKKAILVGDNTYGKNSIQKVIPMPNRTGMNLTIAKYLMPNHEDIHKVGIKPTYKVLFTREYYENNKDIQLEKAQEILKKINSKQHS